MHTRIYPEKDTFIENSAGLFLKNFGIDENLEVSTIINPREVYTSYLQAHQIYDNITGLYVQDFYGMVTGLVSGSADDISGFVMSGTGNLAPVIPEC